MKENHEAWVQNSLPGYDRDRQRDDEVYAGYVDEWVTRANLDNWEAWSSHLLGFDQPCMATTTARQLFELRKWLLSRIWPGRYPELERAFGNFGHVLNDLQETFRLHAEPRKSDISVVATCRFYKIDRWDEKLYHRLLGEYEEHVDLVKDFTLELTRAANLVCDEVRRALQPSFRMSEGRLLIQYGPNENLGFVTLAVAYSDAEAASGLYPGLEDFKAQRGRRDAAFGICSERGLD